MNTHSLVSQVVRETPRRIARSHTAGALLALALISSAPAQVAPATAVAAAQKAAPIKMEAFVSTGTRFNDRTIIDSPVPIDVILASDLKLGAYTEPAQMIQALVPSFNFPRATIADGTDHVRPATLRGLAPDQTLVLLNGKRRHTSSLVNVNGTVGRGSVSMDYNAIPSAAIGRAEVLRDGASAQYGSDAIAGVINVVLDRSIGSGFNATYGSTKEGDGDVRELSAYSGVPFGANGYLRTTVHYKERDGTNRSERDTRQQYFGRSAAGAVVAIQGGLNSGLTPTGSTATLDSREASFNRLNHWQGDSETRDTGFFVNTGFALSPAIEAYAFGGYTKRDGKSAGFYRRAGDDRTVRAIYPNGFLPKINSDISDASAAGGLKGKLGDWNWDASTLYGGNRFDFTITDTANVTLGAASPTSLYAGRLQFRQWTNNLDLTNSFDFATGSPLKVAAGLEHRRDQYKIGAGDPDSYRDGGVRVLDGPNAGAQGAPGAQVFPGFRPSDATSRTRDSLALYVDMENQVTKELLVSVAGRFEDYTDFGSKFTVKGSGRYALTKELAVRGSASTGFRAPHLAQQWFSSTATNFIGGVPFENKTFPVSDPVARLMGARPLKPETSLNYSFGTTWGGAGGFSASIDFYRISIDDRIVLSSTFLDGAAPLIRTFLANNGQPQAVGGRYFTNAVDTETDGVDVSARYIVKTSDAGKVTFTAGYNHNRTKVTRSAPTPAALRSLTFIPLFDETEKVRMEKGQPSDVYNLAVNWDLDKWSFLLRTVRYGQVSLVATTNSGWSQAQIDSVTPGFNVAFAPAVPGITAAGAAVPTTNRQVIQTFDAKWITDLDVTYRITPKVGVSIGASNLLDRYPTKNLKSNPSFSGNDNVGIFPYNGISPFGFNGAFYYGKVSWKF